MTFDYLVSLISHYGVVYAIYTFLLPPVATFFLSYAVPKHIVTKYFRQPHFNDGDDELFNHFPFRYYLTLWIAQLTACNWFARRRQAYDLRKDSPRYWLVLSWISFWLIVIPPITAFLLGLLGLGYFELTGRPVPQV
ncbi:hypothetical protein [Limnobacter sp.]|uniref:hypothetical protein n=1 Tax=Limnobacter sp. TaxID=2003368 RepID=UPI0027326470|nr:hypothetical protein [Limnobacter sp.]MDP3188176.1 hypothetical protein [Limnobacter sp.]